MPIVNVPGWIGSSAVTQTGQRWMGAAGESLNLSKPFWMSQMAGLPKGNLDLTVGSAILRFGYGWAEYHGWVFDFMAGTTQCGNISNKVIGNGEFVGIYAAQGAFSSWTAITFELTTVI